MKKHHFLELTVPPPLVFLIFAGFMWMLSSGVPWTAVKVPASKLIAPAFAAAGGIVAAASILSFLRAKTTFSPEKPDTTSKLVVSGMYAVSRNPMYLSLLFILIGWGIHLSNIASLFPVLFFIAYLNRFQILPEERVLAPLFGSEYDNYRARVRRWL